MEQVTLGSTTLEISRIGFGAWAAGGSDWFHGWSGQKDEDSVAAIQRAVALGVNWIDTAAVYGFGHSEKIVGRALDGVRPRPYVFTKCGALEGAHGEIRSSLARDSILAEAEASLRRLHTDQIDVYQVHRPRPAGELEEGWKALAELREQGVVRHIGASNVTVEHLRRLDTIAPVEIVQPRYSLLAREAEDELLPYARRHGIGIIVYSPMASGLLTGSMSRARLEALPATDWRRNDERFAEPTLTRGLELAERVRTVASRHGVTAAQVAVAWTLRNPAVHGAIVGFRDAAQVESIIGAAVSLVRCDLAELEMQATSPGAAGDVD